MERIEVNVSTGEQILISLTPDEIATALASAAATEAVEAPIRAERAAQQQLRVEAKATAMFDTLKSATLAQIRDHVIMRFPAMTTVQQNEIAMLYAVAAMFLRER